MYVHLAYTYYETVFCSKGLLIVFFVILFSFIHGMFNFCIYNEVGKPIINEYLFYIFTFIPKDSLRGR